MSAWAAADTPSAELLLYLAEFADEQGRPEDPIEITAESPPARTESESEREPEAEPEADAVSPPPAADADD